MENLPETQIEESLPQPQDASLDQQLSKKKLKKIQREQEYVKKKQERKAAKKVKPNKNF